MIKILVKRRCGLLIAGIVLLLAGSCKKLTEIPFPDDLLVTPVVFSDSIKATAAITGIYANITFSLSTQSLNIINGGLCIYTGVMGDELYSSSVNDVFYNNNIPATNNQIIAMWRTTYTFIYQANACIEGALASKALTTSLQQRIVAEATFLRSYLLFNLVNLYGRIPMIISTDYVANSILPQSSKAVIYDKVIADLKQAESILEHDPVPLNNYRVNRNGIKAFMARVYMYREQWAEAEEKATAVLNAGYKIQNNIDSVFLNGSAEAVWQLTSSIPGYETIEGRYFVIPQGVNSPLYSLTTGLVNAFETGDNRKTKWINKVTAQNGSAYILPYKFKLGNINTLYPSPQKEASTPLRISEQYLIRAEARAHLGKLEGARQDLDIIRLRAGLNKTTAATQGDILRAIMSERRVELFCEGGHRWFDLIRTGTIDSILGAVKPGWKSSAALFPIPASELALNPFLQPNP